MRLARWLGLERVPSPSGATTDNDVAWLRAQIGELNADLRRARGELKAEISRNRKREDALVGQILALGGGHTLPPRFEAQQKLDLQELNNPALSPAQERVLRERAREIAEQRAGGDPIDGQTVEATFQEMLKDPDYWLND